MTGGPRWLAAAAIDGALLGAFMVAAAGFGTWLEHPDSALHRALTAPGVRRFLMGLAMGLTAIVLIHSPLGQRSGAHMNPATTLAFWRLGRVPGPTALAYVVAQFAGGALGLWSASLLLAPALAAPSVRFVVTAPGAGTAWAFVVELAMTALLLGVVLRVSQSHRWHRATGVVAGALLCTFITLAAPISGTSLNPARTFASAVVAGDFTAYWVYALAPVLGMAIAAQQFARSRRARCAKLHHANAQPCPFRCGWDGA
jgi:aquaporin Z